MTATKKHVCADPTCEQKSQKLYRCCLTGSGDHPRYFFLCGDCLKKWRSRSPETKRPTDAAGALMTERDKKIETRKQRAFDRLGTDSPSCVACGERDWRCLELHHLEGKDFGKTMTIVCRNCHRKLSDMQKDQPARVGEVSSTLQDIGHFLQGLADFLLLLVEKLRKFGEYLIECARSESSEPKGSRS